MARRRTDDEEARNRLVERDLTALAREGKLRPAYGLDEVIGDVIALMSSDGKHPLLAGDPGVGKTAIVQEIARRIVTGAAGPALADARVMEISIAGILARGERHAADTLDELLERLAEVPKTVVYVRDLAVGVGGPTIPVMIRSLRTGSLRFVLEADLRRAQELLRSDETMGERLHLLPVHEPPPDRVRWILAKVAEDLEKEHLVPFEPAAIDLAFRLSSKFLVAQRMPRKAIELLQETAAETAAASKERAGPDDVLSRFCATTLLPRFVVDDAMPLDLQEVSRFFGERLLGQTDAVAAVLRSVALLKAGLNDPRRPLGVFLFAGPTGVGKTHLAKLLAEYLFGSPDRLVRLNMADYPGEDDDAVPFGQPWAESLSKKRGDLTQLLDGKVFAVLLLDEFEKAHERVHDRFLQLFDEGQFVNAAGETVPCNNVLIVATSNAGAEVYQEQPIGIKVSRSQRELLSEVDRRIASVFRPEFLNRFDAICHFHPLSKIEIRKIAHREVGRVLEREGIRARGLDVEVAPEVVDLLVERGYSPHFGARFLQREIEKTLTSALAVEIVKRPLPPGTPVRVESRPDGSVVASSDLRAPREATAQVVLPTPGAGAVRRRLDKKSLQAEAENLVARASRIGVELGRPDLESRRARLLPAIQAPDFWDDPAQAAATLREFRGIEAKLSELDRVARGCAFARKLVRDARGEQHLASAARAVEEMAREVQLLEARGLGPLDVDEVLIEVEAAADSPAAQDWVRELGFMYLGWAEKRGYDALAVAEATAPWRVLLRVGGPGALGFLAGESGMHRRMEKNGRVGAYVRVRLWPKDKAGAHTSGREIRRRPGFFVERLSAEASAKDEATGRMVTLHGAAEVAELRALAAALLEIPPPAGEVRRYLPDLGARVEDPRTGASGRIKEVLRGELEPFIAAWMDKGRAPTGEAPAQ
ncbi:MAG TPA: AAA family ATPase [Myxococcaceae bacterium]|nr:AAA family ATPase [Myxococcaceae bacterium]